MATTEFGTNLVVEAGAGTGKTSLLVERVLNAIGSGILEIDRLAAITFTEKAAGEMRQRVARELDRLRALARGEERDWEEESEADRAFRYMGGEAEFGADEVAVRALAALEGLDRADILTIHAFCSGLLRSHPLEAGVEPGFDVDSGEQEAVLRELAWDRFVARELGPRAPRPALWRELLRRVPLEDIREIATRLSGFGPSATVLAAPERCAVPAALLSASAARLVEETETLLERAVGLTKLTKSYFETMRRLQQVLRDRGLADYVAAVKATGEITRRFPTDNSPKTTDKLFGVSPRWADNLSKALLRLARNLVEADDETVRMLLEALGPHALEVREQLLRQGLVSFDGLLALARDLLRDHPAVREELKRRYRMLLVDEFQDTDPLQYEIVLFLAEREGGRARDPFRAELEPGRLFIVGDPKQSIYRFRGADYAAYSSAVERICAQGGATVDLVTNFRSLDGVVNPVNRLFEPRAGGAWSGSDHQPAYVPIEAWRHAGDDAPRTELWTLDLPGGASAAERRRAEGQVLAEEIERLSREGKIGGYGEVSILLRTFTGVGLYLRALRERGIPFVIDGGREFLRRPEVAQLLAALRTLAQPADQAALLAFLRSPAGGLSDTELAAYAAAGGRWDWREEPDLSLFAGIAERFAALRELRRETRHLPADAVVRRVTRRTLMLPLGGAAYEGAQRVANLNKLAAAAAELARDGRLSLDEVVEALREGRLVKIEGESPLADDLARAVRISSIHGMKGLENRWVFLADLARGRGGGRSETVELSTVPTGDGGSLAAVRAGRVRGSAWAWLQEENRRHDEAEEARVLYVALTRARDRLVLVVGPSGGGGGWIEALSPWGYRQDAPPDDDEELCDGQVLHRVVAPRGKAERVAPEAPLVADEVVRAHAAAVRAIHDAASPPFVSPSGLELSPEDERPVEPESGTAPAGPRSRDLARATGILVHRLLEGWDRTTPERLREELRPLALSVAAEEGVDPTALEAESREIADRFLESELGQSLRKLDIVDRELPLLYAPDDGPAYRGVIDLLYRDPDGSLVVADYKTDREEDDEALRRDYAPQLRIYAEAVRAALGLDAAPRAELWHLRTGRRIGL
jgi:ATP-dependent helicase/nuclease subunit A